MSTARRFQCWGVQQRRSDKCANGASAHLIVPIPWGYYAGLGGPLFATRDEARAWIKKHWGYLRQRPDLRAAPHGWLMPKPVRVWVTVSEVAEGDA